MNVGPNRIKSVDVFVIFNRSVKLATRMIGFDGAVLRKHPTTTLRYDVVERVRTPSLLLLLMLLNFLLLLYLLLLLLMMIMMLLLLKRFLYFEAQTILDNFRDICFQFFLRNNFFTFIFCQKWNFSDDRNLEERI